MSWILEHLDELVEQYAAEDRCTPDQWRQRAISQVVRERYALQEAIAEAKARIVETPECACGVDGMSFCHVHGKFLVGQNSDIAE